MGNKIKEFLRRLFAGKDGPLISLFAAFLLSAILLLFIKGSVVRLVLSLIQLAIGIAILIRLFKTDNRRSYSRIDALNGALLVLVLVFSVINAAIDNVFVGLALSVLQLAIVVVIFLRLISPKYAKREAENRKFLQLVKPITDFCKLQSNRFRDRKTHVYRKCPKCGAVLRLPKTSGTHTVKCPRCAERFEVKVK